MRDRPTPASAAPLATLETEARGGTRRRRKKPPASGPRQRCLLRAMLGGEIGSGAAGGRPPPMRAWARRYRQAYRVLPAAPHAPDGARPTQRWIRAPRYGGAIRPPRRGAGGTAPAWPGHAGAEGPPNVRLNCAAGRFDRWHHAYGTRRVRKTRQVPGRASGVSCRACWAAD